MDPYKILNVSRGASDSEIKKAYRKLAAKHHPDKSGDETYFKQINEAYSVIGTQKKRQEYEASQSFGSFGGFGDMFESFFGSRDGRFRAKSQLREQSDDEIIFDLKISLSQIKKGISQNIVFYRNKKCNPCGGVGGKNKKTCSICRGNGVQTVNYGRIIQQTACRPCFGLGYSFEEECTLCRGDGMVRVEENIKFIIENR